MGERRRTETGKIAAWAAGIGIVVLIAYAAFRLSRPAVTVTRVIRGPVVQAFYATGTVRPRIEYPILSSVGGIVQDVFVSEGDSVAKDQPLAIVIDPNLQYQADKARAELATARDFADPAGSPVLRQFDRQIAVTRQMLEAARQEEKRFATLMRQNAGSANDRDQAYEHERKIQGDLDALEAQRDQKLRQLQQDLAVAEAADRAAQVELRRQTLRSPVAGVVLDQPVSRDTRVEVNGHVMQIADVSVGSLVMRAAVDEENIAAATVGRRVKMTLYAFADRVFDGVVERKYPRADPDRRTFDVDVRFDHPDPLLQAGMTGELAFVLEVRGDVRIVPSQAVQESSVWTVRGGRLFRSSATIGVRGVERTEITGGLSEGEPVVISPIGGLSDGKRVRVGREIDPKTAADLNRPAANETFNGFQ